MTRALTVTAAVCLGACVLGAVVVLTVRAVRVAVVLTAPTELYCREMGPVRVTTAGVGFVVRCP